MVTVNTYDSRSVLLLYTDVTVNGTRQRVSSVTYDDLGRIIRVTRGDGSNSGGTVSYAYNLHGQTTSITGPGLSQRLHYTDGRGNPLKISFSDGSYTKNVYSASGVKLSTHHYTSPAFIVVQPGQQEHRAIAGQWIRW